MCNICTNVKNGYEPKDFNKLMTKIETKIKSGVSGEHFKEALDILLSTELNETNDELDTAWEEDYRGTD